MDDDNDDRPTLPVPRALIGDGDRSSIVPVVVKSPGELRALPLDPRAGFVLTHIDGNTDLESLLDLTGLPEQETLAIVASLLSLGALSFSPAA